MINSYLILSYNNIYATVKLLAIVRSNYVQYLGQDEDFKAHLISQDSSEALKEIIEQFRLNNNIVR